VETLTCGRIVNGSNVLQGALRNMSSHAVRRSRGISAPLKHAEDVQCEEVQECSREDRVRTAAEEVGRCGSGEQDG
jgi:hypothetical protein